MLLNIRRKNTNSARERVIWGDIMALGMVFPIAITLGFFLGRWAGRLLGHPKIGITLGLVWGIAAGFFELYRVAVQLNILDKTDKGNSGHGDDHGVFK